VATSGSAFVFDGTNVGIGTSSPGQKLTVQGGINVTSSATLPVAQGAMLFSYEAPINRIYMGDGTGYSFAFSKRASSTTTDLMTLTDGGNLGIGTTSPSYKLDVNGAINIAASNFIRSGSNPLIASNGSTFNYQYTGTQALHWQNQADNATRMVLTDGGNLGIGTTSPNYKISAIGSNTQANFGATNNKGAFVVSTSDSQAIYTGGTYYNGSNWVATATTASYVACDSGNTVFANNSGLTSGNTYTPSERARITSDGNLLVGKTTDNFGTEGIVLYGPDDANSSRINVTTDGQTSINVNRLASDGDLVGFYQATTQEGSISVSGNTVSYNAFAGSHWSQLQDGSKPDILRGTVMESINELCVWPDENNERLPKAKISDTAGSKKVYGVFMAWDNDWTTTNDMYVTAVGAFICRVNASVTVQEGDLLESNGDGTARVQADDIIRSSTIGKVTSTVKTHQYDDGSYCVPTVLYCG
jgi:hypothetical protein